MMPTNRLRLWSRRFQRSSGLAAVCLSSLIGCQQAYSQSLPKDTNAALNSRSQSAWPVDLQTVSIDGIQFTIPSKLKLQKISNDQVTTWPIVATWDVDHSLLIAESVWTKKQPVSEQLKTRPHRIVRLRDTNNDGSFDSRQVVAEQLSFPEGVLSLGKDILVAAPPEIWRLTDADGDGVCESRDVWFDGKTLTGCANDLHGPWLAPDGWIYWSKSAFAEQVHETIGGGTLKSSASHLFRRHPSGGPIESVMSGGMDNLVDVAFLPNGEKFFCATFLHHPRSGFRDGIGHVVYGAVFGKPHNVIDSHWKTGPLMEPMIELGPAAPAGLLHVDSIDLLNAADPEYKSMDSMHHEYAYLASAQFNLQKIGLHQLTRSEEQSTYTANTIDLLSADKIDFHPVDVLQDTDGSLIVVDTGGWYDLCCPSSASDQRVALGGIYRLSANQPAAADAAYQEAQNPTAKAEKSEASRSLLELQKMAVERRSDESQRIAFELMMPDAIRARVAAEAVGRLRERGFVSLMLTLYERQDLDRTLEHAILYALMESNHPEEVAKYLKSSKPRLVYAAAIVLDQTQKLEPSHAEYVLSIANHKDAKIRNGIVSIIAHHPEWADASLPLLKNLWASDNENAYASVQQIVSEWIDEAAVQDWVADELSNYAKASQLRQDVLINLIAAVRKKALPNSWQSSVLDWFKSADEPTALKIATALKSSSASTSVERFVELVSTRALKTAAMNKADALALLSTLPSSSVVPAAAESMVIDAVVSEDASIIAAGVDALSRLKISKDSASYLVRRLGDFAPLQLRSVLEAILLAGDTSRDEQLLQTLTQLPATKTLDAEWIIARLNGRSEDEKQKWRLTLSKLNEVPQDVAKSLDDWLQKLPVGDAAKGYHVFRSAKAACSACHQVGYVGGNIGPELSRIGKSRTRRDLIEAIVYPSVRLAQSYQPEKVRTSDGQVYNGLIIKQTGKEIELQVAADKRVSLLVEDIESRAPSTISVMPAGLEQQLTIQELADLIAFLENAK